MTLRRSTQQKRDMRDLPFVDAVLEDVNLAGDGA
jgi:hypothetical protein